MRTLVVLAAVLALAACGPASRGDDGTGGDDGSGSGSGSGNADGCSDAAKLVYVVDANNTFAKFDPMTKTFTNIGMLSCPGETGGLFGGSPFSMGIDRNAVAWVLFNDGKLFHVDTSNAACTSTTWSTQQGELLFGMGFSANTAGSTDDTLFIAGGSSDPMSSTTSKLATLSTTSFSAAAIGNVTGWPELTGNGNAELWGWFPDASMPRIEQIDKANGMPVQGKTYSLPSLSGTPMAWAFAFWGGDYWIFLERSNESSTTVYQVNGSTIKGMTATGGREIVGAGVSTCAPTVIL